MSVDTLENDIETVDASALKNPEDQSGTEIIVEHTCLMTLSGARQVLANSMQAVMLSDMPAKQSEGGTFRYRMQLPEGVELTAAEEELNKYNNKATLRVA